MAGNESNDVTAVRPQKNRHTKHQRQNGKKRKSSPAPGPSKLHKNVKANGGKHKKGKRSHPPPKKRYTKYSN